MSNQKDFVNKIIYFGIVLIILSNIITSYSIIDGETGLVIFTMGDISFNLDPLIYSSAGFVNRTLTTGLLIVLVSLQKIQKANEAKSTLTMEGKINLILETQAIMLQKDREQTRVSTELSKEIKDRFIEQSNVLIQELMKNATTLLNEKDLSLKDLINNKLKIKEVLNLQLSQALKMNDTTIVSNLTKTIKTVSSEIEKLQKKSRL